MNIPRIAAAPKLSDFEGMTQATELAKSMSKVERFIQRAPQDGAPITQRTEAYLGYTSKDLYIMFLAFDTEPQRLRARLLRRELIDDDDQVGFFLDTFNDKRHAYYFYSNAYGVQQDGLFTERMDFGSSFDNSFDTIWNSDAKITGNGYMVLFDLPFKSLRFNLATSPNWGVFLERVLPRNSEHSFYPSVTSRVQGWLPQTGTLEGLQGISPGRNIQFIPYGALGAFRELDDRDPAGERFTGKHVQPKVGLDSKFVIKDSLVLDATVNPDFGQIESDDPQVTVNQRFEVFFPEKRPFFQENSNYFQTPLNLVFTRRVVNPLYGLRLTGKLDNWDIGTFFADDRQPGKSVIAGDPLFGEDAYFGVFRLNREFGHGSSVGMIYTDRELHTSGPTFCSATPCLVGANRVGGVDTQLRFNEHWRMDAQAITSETKFNDGSRIAGPAYHVYLDRTTRSIEYNTLYEDISPGFSTETGFVPRTDYRHFSNFASYHAHPEGKHLISHGPRLFQLSLWDHNNTRLNYQLNPGYDWNFQRNSFFSLSGIWEHERLRPVDFAALTSNRDYTHVVGTVGVGTQYFKWLNLKAGVNWGTQTNFVPRNGPPVLAFANTANVTGVVRPTKSLTIENTYLMTRFLERDTRANIFNNHIVRSKWNYQFTKEFSLRLTGQYVGNVASPTLTSLQNIKSFNGDVLFTYLVHPGTAIYAGYNSNLENIDPSLQRVCAGLPCAPGQAFDGLLRTRSSFINDGRVFFIKVSYLFRY